MKRRHGVFLALVLAAIYVPGLRAGECGEDPAHYKDYGVRSVEIATPISFFAAATYGFEPLKQRLPLQAGQPFSVKKLSDSNALVREYVEGLGAGSNDRLKLVVVTPKLENCDEGARTLAVRYLVFTNIYRPALSHTFEQRADEVQRPATAAAAGGAGGRFLVRPFAGYDKALHGFGGIDISSQLPLGPLRSLRVHASASSNSTTGEVNAGGSSSPHATALDHAVWQLAFRYADLPAGAAKVKEGKLAAQFSGSSAEFSRGAFQLRYGAALEGGHEQTGGTEMLSPLPVNLVPINSSFGALKLFAGATARSTRQAFAASYGLELGSTFRGNSVDFSKHVVDLDYSVRFLRVPAEGSLKPVSAGVHRALDMEVHATGGIIHGSGMVPPAERFYGGNHAPNFMAGSDWIIPDGAVIRSIPQNQLGGLGIQGLLGGTRFYSGNVTVAKTIWGRPLLPKEMAEDKDFVPVLNGAIKTARGTLLDYYKSQDPAFVAAGADVDAIAKATRELPAELDRIPAAAANVPAVASSLKDIRAKLPKISRTLASIKKGDNTEITVLVRSQLPALEEELSNLVEQLEAAGAAAAGAPLRVLRAMLGDSRQKLAADIARVNSQAAQDKADADFAPAQKVLNSFLYELNIYSIAPVAIFDVARVWPSSSSTRYAVGGGVRLSLVNANFTLGYAANPKRNPGEAAGALFVSLDVSDLFH